MGRGQRYSTAGRNSYYDRLMDQRADDRRFQQRLALSGGGSDETPGQWIDPLAIGPGATPAERVQQRAQLKRRDRKRRLGRPEQATEPKYKPGSQIEQEQEQKALEDRRDEERRHQSGLLEDAEFDQDVENDEEHIGLDEYSDADAAKLRQANKDLAAVREDKNITDGARQENIERLEAERDAIRGRRVPETAAQRANKTSYHLTRTRSSSLSRGRVGQTQSWFPSTQTTNRTGEASRTRKLRPQRRRRKQASRPQKISRTQIKPQMHGPKGLWSGLA